MVIFFSESMNAISPDQPGKIFNLQVIKLDFANKHQIGMKWHYGQQPNGAISSITHRWFPQEGVEMKNRAKMPYIHWSVPVWPVTILNFQLWNIFRAFQPSGFSDRDKLESEFVKLEMPLLKWPWDIFAATKWKTSILCTVHCSVTDKMGRDESKDDHRR